MDNSLTPRVRSCHSLFGGLYQFFDSHARIGFLQCGNGAMKFLVYFGFLSKLGFSSLGCSIEINLPLAIALVHCNSIQWDSCKRDVAYFTLQFG